MASMTRGEVTIDSGLITVHGKRIGYVGMAHKFGYHPAVRLTLDARPADETWFENDEPELLDKIFAAVQKGRK